MRHRRLLSVVPFPHDFEQLVQSVHTLQKLDGDLPEKRRRWRSDSSGNAGISLTALILPMIYIKDVICLGIVGGRISLLDVDVYPA